MSAASCSGGHDASSWTGLHPLLDGIRLRRQGWFVPINRRVWACAFGQE